MKKTSLFFLFLTLSFLAISILNINQVNAQTTYEWIQNGGFDDSSGNMFINNGFETGDFTGYSYHNSWVISSTQHNTGAYSAWIGQISDSYLTQTINILSSTISIANLYAVSTGGSATVANPCEIKIYVAYSGHATTNSQFSVNNSTFTIIDFIGLIVSGYNITSISIEYVVKKGSDYVYIDDIYLGNSGSGQTTITPSSSPWFTDLAIGTYYPRIVTDTSNTSPNSCLFEIGEQHYNAVMQVLSNLASDSATSFTLYALDASGSGGASLIAKIHYTDGSWSTSQPTAITGSWIQYDFTYLIVPHKIIDEIYIKPTDFTGSYIYVDTVSLLSTNPTTYISFSFDLSPSPIWINSYPSGYTLSTFGSYEGQSYIATCTMYNNSIPSGNGTFLVTSSISSYFGTILNGVMSFTIAKRTISVNNTQEQFKIDITSNLFNTSAIITAYWYKLDYSLPDIPDTTEKTNQFINAFPIILIMALFIIPATYYLGVGGFVGGFSIGSIICVWTGLAPSWFIAIVILTDIVMIFFATRTNNSSIPSG